MYRILTDNDLAHILKAENVVTVMERALLARQPAPSLPTDITLFCSVGLAGTEVVLANEALRLAI